MAQQVHAAGFHQAHVFAGVGFGQRTAGHGRLGAAVVLEGAHRGHDDGGIGLEAAHVTLDVPELFVTDFGTEAGFRHMDVAELEGHAVGDDGALAQGDVAEGTGVHQHGLAFDGLDQVGFAGFQQPGHHGAVHFQVGGGHGIAGAVKSQHHARQTLAQIGQVAGKGHDGHDLRGGRDVEARTHHETVVAAAVAFDADDDVAQGLTAEVHGPAHAHAGGIDVEAAHAGQAFQLFVVIVALVLHARGQGHHGQVVGRGDGVDVAGEIQGIRGQRDALGQTAARSGALHAHGGAARRLADGRRGFDTTLGEALHQTDGSGGLAFAQRGRRDGGHVHIFAIGPVSQTAQHRLLLDLAHVVAVRQQLVLLKPQLGSQGFHSFHRFFGILGDLPVRVLGGIKSHGFSFFVCLLLILLQGFGSSKCLPPACLCMPSAACFADGKIPALSFALHARPAGPGTAPAARRAGLAIATDRR